MKEKQNKRWGLKLLSVVCAFLVWLGVVNVADPVVTGTVEVPVEIVNTEILGANNLTYEIIGKKTTTVAYEVKTTNAHRIRPTDFRAYADMSDLWAVTGSIPIKVEVLNHAEYLVSTPSSRMSTIKIETEPLQKKRFDLNVIYTGELDEGYEAGEISLSPNHIYVEGPESLIGQISSVGIEISLEGLTMDAEGNAVPKYYDANGNKIDLDSRITSDCESVSYKMPVLKVKNLTLDFETSGEVAEGYRFTGVECELKSVPVIGMKSVLAALNTLTIPGEALNMDGAKTNMVRTIDLNNYLPVGVSLAGTGRHEINVTLTVEPLRERSYTVQVNDESIIGKKDNYKYTMTAPYVYVRIKALKEELDSLNLKAEDIEIDVSLMGEGTHTVDAKLKVDLDSVYEVIDVSSCTVHVEKEEESQETIPVDGQAAAGTEASTDNEDESSAETEQSKDTSADPNAERQTSTRTENDLKKSGS